MINVTKFRHVAIVVEDLDRMINFYVDVLGFELKREIEIESDDFRRGVGLPDAKAKGAHLIVPNSDVEIEMFEFKEQIERNSELSLANHPGYRHIALIVDNLEETYECLEKEGIEFYSEPIHVKEPANVAGFRFVYFKDPEGNIIELNQLPN